MLFFSFRIALAFQTIFLQIIVALAGNVAQGGNCSLSSIHLDSATHKLISDCDEKTFCTPQNNCEPRQCRKDEFEFGYNPGETLPPLCPSGQYCPDEGDACKPLLSLGQRCQLNRDDQCGPPPMTSNGTGSIFAPNAHSQSPMYTNSSIPIGSICLHLVCMYANVSLGMPCTTDSTVYVGSGPKRQQFSNTVTRDNCITPGLYCNSTSGVCEENKQLGQPCQNDQECESYNCSVQNICAVPPGTPLKVPVWQYVVTGCAILLAMIAICLVLVLAHRRHRRQRKAEIREYYHEQMGYRRSIMALHSVAGSSIAYNRSKLTSSFSQASSESLNVYSRLNDVPSFRGYDAGSIKRRD